MLTHTHVKTSINIRSDAAMYSFMSSYFSKKINLNYSICTVYWVFCSQFLSHSFFRFFSRSFVRSLCHHSWYPIFSFGNFAHTITCLLGTKQKQKRKKTFNSNSESVKSLYGMSFLFVFFSLRSHTHTFLCVKKERIPNNLQFVLLIFGWTFFYTIRFSDWFGKFKE